MEQELTSEKSPKTNAVHVSSSESSLSGPAPNKDLMELLKGNEILSQKMELVAGTLDKIGWTPYHLRLFMLTGLGFAFDTLLMSLQSLTQYQVNLEFGVSFPGGAIAICAGSTLGILLWGSIGDIFGRRITFNATLFLGAVFTLINAGMPTYAGYCVMCGLSSFFASGNLILDGVVFLEFLPFKYQFLQQLLFIWWSVGQTSISLISWPLLTYFSCNPYAQTICVKAANMGWRYCWICGGGIVLIFSFIRYFFIHLVETPRYSLVAGNEEQLIKDLDKIAGTAKRSHDLTLEKLQACGKLSEEFTVARKNTKVVFSLIAYHYKLLYSQVKLGFFITNMQVLWFINGFAYPMYAIFLPYYLMSRGASSDTMNMTYRDMAIVSACGAGGTFLSCVCAELIPKFGKKGSMILGNTLTSVFLFCYTQVRTQQQNLAFSCCVYLTINFGYVTLFSYTTEILPSQFRSTATSVCASCSRIAGVISPFVAYYTNTSSNAPIFICAALYAVIALLTILLPYESVGRRLF